MSLTTCVTWTAGCFFFVTTIARGDFLCSSIELVEDDGPGGTWTWRVYLEFDDPQDELLSVGGVPGLAPLTFEAEADLWNSGGPFSGLKTEDFPAGEFSDARDSWVTIGSYLGFPNPSDYSPGFAGSDGVTSVIKGDSFAASSGGWFLNPKPTIPVTGTRILIAQFTLPSGADFAISGVARWLDRGNEPPVMSIFEGPLGCPLRCASDIDESGDVGLADLLAVLAAWGPCVGCPMDLDGDDWVGLTDLLTVLATWGPCS